MTAPSPVSPAPSDRAAFALFAGAVALGGLLLAVAGPAPQLLFPADDVAYLDACHRASLGQSLGRDFNSPIGPAALLPTALAMKLFGAKVQAFAIGSVFTWFGFAALAWVTVKSRMPGWLAALFGLFVAATAAAPYTLDFGSWQILSYGMLYNRLAWAALCLAVAAVLLRRRDGAAARLVPVGLGACAAWLWALKPNYLAVLAPLGVYAFSQRPSWQWLGFSIGGALGTLALVWLGVHFSPVDYAGIHLGMAREAPGGLLGYTLVRSLRENVWLLLGLVAIWSVTLKMSDDSGARGRGIALVAVAMGAFAANVTNCQFSEIPLWGALGWIAVAGGPDRLAVTPLTRAAALGGAAIGLGFTWQPLTSIAYNFAWKQFRAPNTPAALNVASGAWEGMPMRALPGEAVTPTGPLESPGNYAAWLNEGLALFAQIRPPTGAGSILCVDWTNPFPFATGTIPARGDEIAWHVGRTVGPRHHPDVGALFAQAWCVMEPRRSLQPDSLAFKRRLFATELATSFIVGAETPHWIAWVRRSPVTTRAVPTERTNP